MRKNTLLILGCALLFSKCGNKNMSLEELKKASWSKVEKGYYYISMEEQDSNPADTIVYTFIGASDTTLEAENVIHEITQGYFKPIHTRLLEEKLPKSKRGYLKIDLAELLTPDTIEATIGLSDSYDTSRLDKDLKILREIPGVLDVRFISKEIAKQIYLSDGNEPWDDVLQGNPLPEFFKVIFNKERINTESYGIFEDIVRAQIQSVSDIKTNASFPKRVGKYYIIEYNKTR